MLQLTGSALILGAALWLQRSFHLRTLLRQRTLRALSGAFLALERVWESGTPPLHMLGVPVELTLREPHFFIPEHK